MLLILMIIIILMLTLQVFLFAQTAHPPTVSIVNEDMLTYDVNTGLVPKDPIPSDPKTNFCQRVSWKVSETLV